MSSEQASGIIVTLQLQEEIHALQERLQQFRVVTFAEEDFKVEHAKAVISEAYVSEQTLKYIIIAAKNFNQISQNSLLKLFEEPPRNIRFIVIVESKSILLDTIKSRLPILKYQTNRRHIEVDLDFSKIDNAMIFAFIKEHERIKKQEAKDLHATVAGIDGNKGQRSSHAEMPSGFRAGHREPSDEGRFRRTRAQPACLPLRQRNADP